MSNVGRPHLAEPSREADVANCALRVHSRPIADLGDYRVSTPSLMYQIPPSIFLLAMTTGAFFWMHIVLALIVRVAVRQDSRAVEELFATGAPHGLILHSYLMRVKLFLPWVATRAISDYSKLLKGLVWTARGAGTSLIVSFLLLIGDFIYLASSGP